MQKEPVSAGVLNSYLQNSRSGPDSDVLQNLDSI
jgi:hypothetical protein